MPRGSFLGRSERLFRGTGFKAARLQVFQMKQGRKAFRGMKEPTYDRTPSI